MKIKHVAMAVYVLDSIKLVSKHIGSHFTPSRCPQFWLHVKGSTDIKQESIKN